MFPTTLRTRIRASTVRPARTPIARAIQPHRSTVLQASRVHSSVSLKTSKPAMFCFQCEQTEHGTGCTTVGVCGKTAPVSRLQDLVIAYNKAIGLYMNELTNLGVKEAEVEETILFNTFSTLTNVNFDDARFVEMLKDQQKSLDKVKALYAQKAKEAGVSPKSFPAQYANLSLPSTVNVNTLVEKAKEFGILERKDRLPADYVGLQEMIGYGLKGLCAYAHHAHVLGRSDPSVAKFVFECLAFLCREDASVDELLGMALKVGEVNLLVMSMLEDGHISKFGNPVPTKVRASGIKGNCILVSGHDIADLYELLKQTEGKGINVYTHGEMLPAHAYPELKKFKHLAGNYGTAWQNQKFEFAMFPGPIVMTSNCIIEPMKSYKKRIFTRSSVGWPGVTHLPQNDYSAVIEAALAEDGFEEDEPEKYFTTGFGKNTVLSVAPQVIDGVKNGAIKHFFLIGGCDGTEGQRSYFTDVAKLAPADTVILTLACGKYRINNLELGSIGGIPRLLDMGQCNDSFGAIQVAVALAKAFNTDVNSLPLSLVISWFEQKAVAVLLTLLHLGIKGIYLGPNLPAFCTPTMLEILIEKFHLRQIGDPQADVADMLAGKK